MWHALCSDQHQKSRQVGAVGVGWMASATSHAACKGARAEAAWQAACAVKCLHPGCCRSAADKTAALAGRLCSASAAVLAAAGQQLHSQAALHKATKSSEGVTQSRRKRLQVAGKRGRHEPAGVDLQPALSHQAWLGNAPHLLGCGLPTQAHTAPHSTAQQLSVRCGPRAVQTAGPRASPAWVRAPAKQGPGPRCCRAPAGRACTCTNGKMAGGPQTLRQIARARWQGGAPSSVHGHMQRRGRGPGLQRAYRHVSRSMWAAPRAQAPTASSRPKLFFKTKTVITMTITTFCRGQALTTYANALR